MKIKSLFWKTYRAKFTNQDRSKNQYVFFRGLTWEVVEMAQKHAKEKSENEKEPFTLEELTRIF